MPTQSTRWVGHTDHVLTPQPAPPLGDPVAAHFQRLEIAMLSRVLTTTQAGAPPPAMVRAERRRTFVEWLTRRPGAAIGLNITDGDKGLTFRAPDIGAPETSVNHTVRGITVSTTPITVTERIDQLAELLNEATNDDESTRPPWNVPC